MPPISIGKSMPGDRRRLTRTLLKAFDLPPIRRSANLLALRSERYSTKSVSSRCSGKSSQLTTGSGLNVYLLKDTFQLASC